jgi:hypothetical protein
MNSNNGQQWLAAAQHHRSRRLVDKHLGANKPKPRLCGVPLCFELFPRLKNQQKQQGCTYCVLLPG